MITYNPVPATFQYMIYNDLAVKNKSQYLISENADCTSEKTCLSECNSQSECMYAYFYSTSTCLLCNSSASSHTTEIESSNRALTYLYKKLTK